jgi:hypothetical protein
MVLFLNVRNLPKLTLGAIQIISDTLGWGGGVGKVSQNITRGMGGGLRCDNFIGNFSGKSICHVTSLGGEGTGEEK